MKYIIIIIKKWTHIKHFLFMFRLIITDESDINTPAVAAAYAGKENALKKKKQK